jgi:HlyD family secretion protein
MGAIIVIALLAAGGMAYSVPSVTKPLKSLIGGTKTDVITTTPVSYGPLPITVVEKGSVESTVNRDTYNNVEGQVTILEIKPEGTIVKKDEVVCTLDSAALRDSLTNQQIATKSAAASYENAKLTREVAEIAVKEYVEGIYLQDLQTVEGEIKLAESDLSRSEDRVDWARRMYEKGYVSLASKVSEELSLKKARFALEQAQQKRRVLVDFTRAKTIKELQSEVEKARSDELAKQSTWALEDSKEKKLVRQIDWCLLKAPSDGLVVYANDANRSFMSNAPQVEEGATVRERQKIFSLPDLTKMQVNAKVHEAQIYQIARGLKAKIRVDAFADKLLDGEVIDVAALPDSTNFFSSDIKVYSTKVRIIDPLPGLRPGMTAEVEILVDRKEKVLTVPVMAVLQFGGKDHVTKKLGDQFVQSEVELGASNDKYVEVTKGVAAGDVVVMDPVALMSDEEKRVAFGAAAKGSKKAWGADTGEEGADATKVAGPGGMPGALKKVGVPGAPPGAPGAAPGALAKAGGNVPGKGATKGAGGASKKGGRGGGFNDPVMAKLKGLATKNLTKEEQDQMSPRNRDTTDDERTKLQKKAGLTDEEIQHLADLRQQMMERFKNGGGGFGGGGGGFGGGGGRRGGDGGGDAGGPQQ